MLINWLKKKVLKSIIKDITKELPKYRDIALLYIEDHKDEVLKKVLDAIKKIIQEEIAKGFNK